VSDYQRPARPAQHEEAGDEVEAHKHTLAENGEASDETENDDEVEAHRHHRLAKHKLQ
jgi:hypothetical protein